MATHPVLFATWGFSATLMLATWRIRAAQKAAEVAENKEFVMSSGTYKHPWDSPATKYNDPSKIEELKGKDYVALSSKAAGLLSNY